MAERAADTNTHLSVLMPPTRKGNVTFIGSKRAIRTQTLLRPQLIQSGYGLFHSSLTADYLGSRPFSSLWVARRACGTLLKTPPKLSILLGGPGVFIHFDGPQG